MAKEQQCSYESIPVDTHWCDHIIAISPKCKYALKIGNLSINTPEGKEPNWFHRWAQRICLGLHWEKIT